MTESDLETYARHRINRAFESFRELDKHIENEFWNTAINRMYYACFYAVSALLIRYGIETASHTGTRQQFGLHFVKTGIISKDMDSMQNFLKSDRRVIMMIFLRILNQKLKSSYLKYTCS